MRIFQVLFLVACLLPMLDGCGGGATPADPTSSPTPLPSTTSTPTPAATPQEMVISESQNLVFISPGDGQTLNYPLYLYGLGTGLSTLTADDQGYIYTLSQNGITTFAPGSALPTTTIPIPPPSGIGHSLFTDARGSQYVYNARIATLSTITVYAQGTPSTGTITRQITLAPKTPLYLEIVADQSGAIYMLDADGSLAYIQPNATGTVMPTILRNANSFYTSEDQNPALTIDSQSNVYLIDGQIENQIDIGKIQSDGSFSIVSTLVDPTLPASGNNNIALAMDDNDALYIFGPAGEVDFYRAGSRGSVAPSITFIQPERFQGNLAKVPAIVARVAPFPTPLPTPGVINFSPSSITLTQSSPTTNLTVGESDFNGTFTVIGGTCVDENASPHPSANITPTAGTTFTITGTFTVAGNCGIQFSDMRGATATVGVTISP